MSRTTRWKQGLSWLGMALLPLALFDGVAHARQNDAVETASAHTWVGKKAQSFTLPGLNGKPIDIARDLGKRPVVLIFYRGVW